MGGSRGFGEISGGLRRDGPATLHGVFAPTCLGGGDGTPAFHTPAGDENDERTGFRNSSLLPKNCELCVQTVRLASWALSQSRSPPRGRLTLPATRDSLP